MPVGKQSGNKAESLFYSSNAEGSSGPVEGTECSIIEESNIQARTPHEDNELRSGLMRGSRRVSELISPMLSVQVEKEHGDSCMPVGTKGQAVAPAPSQT